MNSAMTDTHHVADDEHWIELIIVDEHNQRFNTVKGVLTDSSGGRHEVEAGPEPLVVQGIAAGEISLNFHAEPWLLQAQSRCPNPAENDTDPVQQWQEMYPHGFRDSLRQIQKVTMGDLIPLEKEQGRLPERHRAGQAGELRLLSGHSYILKVQGARYITLRLGIFFDGTSNNSYCARWGEEKLEQYEHKWCEQYLVNQDKPYKEWPEASLCFPGKSFHWLLKNDEKVRSSAANEFTNVQKLFDLYACDKFARDHSVFYHREYITGIGTGNSTEIAKADESVVSQGLGVGHYGVKEKVSTGIKQICCSLPELVDLMRKDLPETFDGIGKFEFDVFGFSRGAAAARHFINMVSDGEKGEFVKALAAACQNHQVHLAPVFEWQSNRQCEITFAGLFDTVAAVADIAHGDFSAHDSNNSGVHLWLDPQRVKHAVHLTASAQTEYRYHFSLNQLNPADNFYELSLPGAHSDLGGGYYSRESFPAEYLLPRFEHKRIKHIQQLIEDNWFDEAAYEKVKKHLKEKLQRDFNSEKECGWDTSVYCFNFKKEKLNRGHRSQNDKWKITGELYLQRIVEGDLSRLYLRLMYGIASYYGVPVDDTHLNNGESIWNSELPEARYYRVPSVLENQMTGESVLFGELCQQVLEMARHGHLSGLQQLLGSDSQLEQLRQLNLIHHSSDEGIANRPDTHEMPYRRKVISCSQGK